MRHAWNTDRTEVLTQLLEELRAGDVPDTGEWLARLVDVIRPGRRGGIRGRAVAPARAGALLESRPEFAAALNAHLTSCCPRACTASCMRTRACSASQGSSAASCAACSGACCRRPSMPITCATSWPRCSTGRATTRGCARSRARTGTRCCSAIDVDGAAFAPARRKCRHELLEAMRLASVRLAALGTDTALLQYLPALARHESPFLAQAEEMREFIVRQLGDGRRQRRRPPGGAARPVRRLRRRGSAAARARRASSVDLVFLLARIEQIIARLRRLRDLVGTRCRRCRTRRPPPAPARSTSSSPWCGRRTVATACATCSAARPSCSRGASPSRRAARASTTSPHRAASSSRCTARRRARDSSSRRWRCSSCSSPGSTCRCCGRAWRFSLNYGLGFVLIHLLHLTIATKQPAMTAATLAAALDGRENREARLDALAELAAEVSRTQWVSIAGNVTITMLTAFAIALTAVQFIGWSPADAAKAAHLLHDLHPWQQPGAAARGDRGRVPVPERPDLGLLRQPGAVSPDPAAAAAREVAAAVLGEERLAASRPTSSRTSARWPATSCSAACSASRRSWASCSGCRSTSATSPSPRPTSPTGSSGLQFAVTPATVVVVRGGRAADRPHQPDGELQPRAQGRAALARHHARADRGPVAACAAAVPRGPRDFFWPPAAALAT